LLVLGAVVSLLAIRNDVLRTAPAATPVCKVACPVGAPPLEPGTKETADRPA
jgi:hypothetical protein